MTRLEVVFRRTDWAGRIKPYLNKLSSGEQQRMMGTQFGSLKVL
jgi:hypothetical protein